MQTFHVKIQFVSRAQIINNEFLNFYKAFKCFNICKCPGCRLVLASVLFSEPTHCLRSQWSELKWTFSLNRNFTSSFQNFAPTCNSPRMLVLSSAQNKPFSTNKTRTGTKSLQVNCHASPQLGKWQKFVGMISSLLLPNSTLNNAKW